MTAQTWVERLVALPRRRRGTELAPLPPPLDPADFDPPLQTRLLILQPTPFCNIDCDYCYLPDRGNRARMSLDTLATAARRLRDDGLLGEALTVVWHAGEPLALPPAYYADAFAALADVLGAHTRVEHSIQTNATLIDERWCALFQEHGVRVGVSVDGPADLHDAHRRDRQGRGTHARVLAGMARLREAGIAFHAIAVVTRDTLPRADAFVDFFEQQGVAMVGCNIDEAEGAHAGCSLAEHEGAHADFLARLLARSGRAGAATRVRELMLAARLVAAPLPQWRWRDRRFPDNAQVLPLALVNVAHNGDFSSFSPELLGQPAPAYGDFVFGNVHRGGCLEALAHPALRRMWADILRGVDACAAGCAHYGYCGGGAPANKWYEIGDFGGAETLYCRAMVKRPFDAVLADAERAIAAAGRSTLQDA